MITELLDMIAEEVTLDKRKWNEVREQLQESVSNGDLHTIKDNGKTIGFYTIIANCQSILINNLLILKEFKDKNNLLGLRKFIRERYPDKEYTWKSRRRNKLRRVK